MYLSSLGNKKGLPYRLVFFILSCNFFSLGKLVNYLLLFGAGFDAALRGACRKSLAIGARSRFGVEGLRKSLPA